MTLIINLCMLCQRFHAQNRDSETCDAFPQGIPEAILDMCADHREPYRGHHGLQFVARPGTADLLPPKDD
jgi:hypothetical protein